MGIKLELSQTDLENKNTPELISHQILRYIKRIQHSLFKSNVDYSSVMGFVENYGLKCLKENFCYLSEHDMEKSFEALGLCYMAPQWKNPEFRNYANRNNLSLPNTIDEWKNIVHSIDSNVLRQIGKLEFYNRLSEEEKPNYMNDLIGKVVPIVDCSQIEKVPVNIVKKDDGNGTGYLLESILRKISLNGKID